MKKIYYRFNSKKYPDIFIAKFSGAPFVFFGQNQFLSAWCVSIQYAFPIAVNNSKFLKQYVSTFVLVLIHNDKKM